MEFKIGLDLNSDGSSSVKIGLTEILCQVKGPFPVFIFLLENCIRF